MQPERKEKQEDTKVSFRAIFNASFANLVSKEYSHTTSSYFLAVRMIN